MNKKSLIKNSILVVVLLMEVVGVVILSNDYDKLILSFKIKKSDENSKKRIFI
jgi:hypothetical protein